MRKFFAASAVVAVASIAFVAAAQAQVTIPPGQDFYATPVQKGPMLTMPAARIAQPAPAAKPKMKHKMAKKKMMTKKMMKKM